MGIIPLNDRVIVQPINQQKSKNIGGIIIPDSVKDKPSTGTVVALGSDETLQKQLQIGNVVVYNQYSGVQLEYDSIKYIILKNDDLLAILQDNV